MPDDRKAPLHTAEKPWRPQEVVPLEQRLASGVFDVTKTRVAGVSFAHRFPFGSKVCSDCGAHKDAAYATPIPCQTTEVPS